MWAYREKPCHWHGFHTAWLQGNNQIFPDGGINGVTFGEIHLIFVYHVGIHGEVFKIHREADQVAVGDMAGNFALCNEEIRGFLHWFPAERDDFRPHGHIGAGNG